MDENIVKLKGYGKILFEPNLITKKHNRQNKELNIRTAYININDDMCDYYSWFFNKKFSLKLLHPIRKSHITFLNDIITDFEKYEYAKNKWNGKEIEFLYKPTQLRSEKGYWWIRVECPIINEIRKDLGLGPYIFGLHITIGNEHPHFKEQFKYIKLYNQIYYKD